MSRGFFTLGSAMMTNNRALGVTSNNIANVNSVGYKKNVLVSSTFGEMMMYRIGAGGVEELGSIATMRSAEEAVTVYSQGAFSSTGRNLDFAISGEGFFRVETDQGYVYTRNGNFSIDEEGYLELAGVGRVVGEDGPIYLGTDEITSDAQGNLFVDSELMGQITLYDFDDYSDLLVVSEGFYQPDTQQAYTTETNLIWQTLEISNVDVAEEMTDAIAAQRNLQACAQALKAYDENLQKAVSEIGRV